MPAFSPEQDAALKAVAGWLKAKPGRGNTPLVFRLFGYAGTGKTTLAKHLAEGVDGRVLFAAFTGKAACVMRCKAYRGSVEPARARDNPIVRLSMDIRAGEPLLTRVIAMLRE